MAGAFRLQGWNKTEQQYERYYKDQIDGMRTVLVAEQDQQFAVYLTIIWKSAYPPFQNKGIPEIADFNVLKPHQRKGIGTILMDEAETRIATTSTSVGIAVGLTIDYGAAHILYTKRGYLPDGQGLVYQKKQPKYGDSITVDDQLVIYLTKKIQN